MSAMTEAPAIGAVTLRWARSRAAMNIPPTWATGSRLSIDSRIQRRTNIGPKVSPRLPPGVTNRHCQASAQNANCPRWTAVIPTKPKPTANTSSRMRPKPISAMPKNRGDSEYSRGQNAEAERAHAEGESGEASHGVRLPFRGAHGQTGNAAAAYSRGGCSGFCLFIARRRGKNRYHRHQNHEAWQASKR